MIIDATDLIVGRLAAVVAKKALMGETVDIVNVEKAVVSGNRADVLAKYHQKIGRSTILRGPYVPRMPDRLLRRTIRGMLPYKQEKGEKAFDRVMCYIGVPPEFQGKQLESLKQAHLKNTNVVNFVTVGEICKQLGAKSHE